MTGWRARLAAVLAVVALATLDTGVTARAAALPVGDCTTTSGVIVAVDFGHWGGPVLRSCGSTPTTAYALLNQGGWHSTGTEHDGPGFICRIGYAGWSGGTQYPTPAQESCVLTPPASAYWAFWYANPGQTAWSYSQAGAMSTSPEPGSVELWVFGGTSSGGTAGSAVPAISPDSLRARNASPVRTVTTAPVTNAATAPPPRHTAPATAAQAPTRTPGATATVTGRAVILDAPPPTSPSPLSAASAPAGHGSVLPALAALVIVLVLAAGGITAVLRRPRREP